MKWVSGISIAAGLLGVGLVAQASATMTVQNQWLMGEDRRTLPADWVGGKNFTDGFSTSVSSVHAPTPRSVASLDFNGFAGVYMANAADDISVPTTNWALEVWVKFRSLSGQVNIASLGTDTVGDGSINSWAKIGYSGNNFFFGRENANYGVLSDDPVVTGKWYELAYVQHDGQIHGYVNGVEATDLGYGDNSPSSNNNGQLHLGVKPGGGQNLDGWIDTVRFSTYAEGAFNSSDLFLAGPAAIKANDGLPPGAVPEPASIAVLTFGALALIRRRRRA